MSSAIRLFSTAVMAALIAGSGITAQTSVAEGPIGPSPYDVVRGWHKPFAEPGFAFGGNSGVFAESPDRIFVAQRGEFRLPTPVPPEFAGFAGSIKMNVLTAGRSPRLAELPLHARSRTARSRSAGRSGITCARARPAPARIACASARTIRERRVWVINETFHRSTCSRTTASKLLKTLGEKNVPGSDATHFAKPQDVAFLPDGRILIADGLDNHRVMILDTRHELPRRVRRQRQGPGPVQRRARRGGRPRRVASSRSIARAAASTCSGRRPIRRRSSSWTRCPASRCRSTSSSTTTACG